MEGCYAFHFLIPGSGIQDHLFNLTRQTYTPAIHPFINPTVLQSWCSFHSPPDRLLCLLSLVGWNQIHSAFEKILTHLLSAEPPATSSLPCLPACHVCPLLFLRSSCCFNNPPLPPALPLYALCHALGSTSQP